MFPRQTRNWGPELPFSAAARPGSTMVDANGYYHFKQHLTNSFSSWRLASTRYLEFAYRRAGAA
jgi:hypothetical protein